MSYTLFNKNGQSETEFLTKEFKKLNIFDKWEKYFKQKTDSSIDMLWIVLGTHNKEAADKSKEFKKSLITYKVSEFSD
jgi:fatty acid-binding protein DegV